jgi:ectoine hydroxylase-related dioxygenase (phytanoyl-CoA dioxygenase family)
VLTAEQRREFDERGIVKLPGAVDPRVAAGLRDEVLALVAARRLVPESPANGFAVTPSRTASVANAHGFEEIWAAAVISSIDDIVGAGAWHVPKHAGQLLAMTYPLRGVTWELPHQSWHLDYRAPGAVSRIPGVQLFLCLDRVESHAGATLVAAGTPRLVDAIRRCEGPDWAGRSADVRQALRRESAWFHELCSRRPGEDRIARFMSQSTASAGGSLQVVELTGDAGDVWAMHPWMVHDASPNCGTRPRLALTERIRVTGR